MDPTRLPGMMRPTETFQPPTGQPTEPLPPIVPALPSLTEAQLSSFEFSVPRRVIGSNDDLQLFIEKSETYQQFIGYITRLSESVKGKPNSYACPVSPIINGIVDLLKQLLTWIDSIEPETNQNSRFGNPAFRQFLDKLAENVDSQLAAILPASHHAAIVELKEYLLHCFGDRQRIDYGTGHEAHFIAFLYCFERIGLASPEDHAAIVLKAFQTYINVMRALQLKYWLEPAGSHGVWGLDDYHFLPFLFGSSQLIGHKHIKPKSILNAEVCDGFAKEYLYLACIKFVNEVKTESLAWHSPMLYDISAVKSWEKVNEGMQKMYRKEVLGKLPIMQHFRFGSLLPFNPFDFEFESEKEGEQEGSECTDSSHDHTHAHGHSHGHSHNADNSSEPNVFYEHATCCISHLPSAIAAKKMQQQQFSKPPSSIPFD